MVEWLASVDGDEFDAHIEEFFSSLLEEYVVL